MNIPLTAISYSLPLTDPVLKFLIILIIILAAPLILNRFKIPHLLGLIIAGAIIGPHGFNLLLRDSSIILSGTAGLLYIMFLAGLEIDMGDFKKNSGRSLLFGMYTFLIPMTLGTAVGLYVLNFSLETSILLASMFASHTLIAYPIISKLGVSKDRAVSITIGGTMITDTLSLLVLTIIVGIATGVAGDDFWARLSVSVVVFALFVIIVFPLIARWFFKKVQDNISQYIFVLVMVFLGAYLAQLAGMEAIIGSFLAGLTLNKLIPHSSPLMHRVEFIGNSIFIPFFLISVGMLIDYRAFFTSFETIKVGLVMIVVATVAKYAAAWLTQKSFKMSVDQRRVIFGLSNAQAAATLAAVMVGYNVILGETASGEPIRLLNESVLNGTILMILVTCTIASFSAQKGAQNIAASNSSDSNDSNKKAQKILMSLSNQDTADELVNMGLALKSKQTKQLYALSILDNRDVTNEKFYKKAHQLLDNATVTAAATDTKVESLLRYDINIANAVQSVILEQGISDLVMGVYQGKGLFGSSIGTVADNIINCCDVTTLFYRPVQPLSTVKRHVIVIPDRADKEPGFGHWLKLMSNIKDNMGAKIVFYGSEPMLDKVRSLLPKKPTATEFVVFSNWNDFLIIFRDLHKDDMLWVVMNRLNRLAIDMTTLRMQGYLSTYCNDYSFVMLFPFKLHSSDNRYLT